MDDLVSETTWEDQGLMLGLRNTKQTYLRLRFKHKRHSSRLNGWTETLADIRIKLWEAAQYLTGPVVSRLIL